MRHRGLSTGPLLTVWLALIVSCGQPEAQEQAVERTTTPVVLTTEEKLANIKDDLKVVKADLAKEGNYNCCVQPGCDWCALQEGECQCYDNAMAKKQVCPGCGLGWHNGDGIVEGVNAKRVKWNITHEHASGGHEH